MLQFHMNYLPSLAEKVSLLNGFNYVTPTRAAGLGIYNRHKSLSRNVIAYLGHTLK